jgi:hypothetical protein
VPPERLDDAVLALLPRFPDNPRLLSRVVNILSNREQADRAKELIEGALERHPERADLYPVALGFYRNLNNETRRRELATAWLERRPDDPGALQNWLSDTAPHDPAEAAERVERFVSAGAGSADSHRANVCEWLLTADRGAHRDAAVRCLSAVAEKTTDPQLRARMAGLLAGAGGSEGELAVRLDSLPPERRFEAAVSAIRALGEGQCERKMALVQAIGDAVPRDARRASSAPSPAARAIRPRARPISTPSPTRRPPS